MGKSHRDVEDHDYAQRWDDGDVKALLAHKRKGLTYAQIADKMGRTVAGVRGKLYRLRKAA